MSICNTLVRYSAKLEAEPELAVSWEASSGGLVWNLKLRQGVMFHNGKTLTPEDVVYSINLHRSPNESIIKAFYAGIKDVRADGKDGVRIEIAEPHADMMMNWGAFQSGVVPDGFTDFANLIGTGPFEFRGFRKSCG